MRTPFLLLTFLAFASIARPAIYTATTTSDAGPGSLRQAILDANAATGQDTITITATGTISLNTALPTITGNVVIAGPGTNSLTVSGNDTVRVFAVNGTATLSGITMANGKATGYANGAAVSNAGSLTITNCALINNHNLGGWGGAVFNSRNLTIVDSTISGNTVHGEAGGNGGAFAGGGGGGAGMGGGLFTSSGRISLKSTVFIGNATVGGPGGSGGGTFGSNYRGGRGGGINGGGGGDMVSPHAGPGGFGGGGGGAGYYGTAGAPGFGGGWGGGWQGGGGIGGGFGGAVFVDSGTVTIVGCQFSGNSVLDGAGSSTPATAAGADFYNRNGTILPTLSASTLGGGTITVDPPMSPYLNNSIASVTAAPAPGWSLVQWLGDYGAPDLTPTVTRNKAMQAMFATSLTLPALVSAYPEADAYPYGTRVKLTARPPVGTFLLSWGGDASGSNNPLTFEITNANPSVSCVLGALNAGEWALTVIENGQGRVATSPTANPYTNGQAVSLSAIPEDGQNFLHWSGDASGMQNPLSVTMDRSKVITANFTKRPKVRVGTTLEGMVEEGFRITLLGEFGKNYGVEGSTNLINWMPLGTLKNRFGTSQFIDERATISDHRYYRAIEE